MKLQKQVFQEIKKKFKKKSILIHFNYEKSVIIDMNASERVMRAQLQQTDDKKQRQLITCYAWKLTLTEQQYDVHDREMLAIIEALEQWRTYL